MEAVLFDMDGTLVDTRSVVPAAYSATITALGGPAVSATAVVDAYRLGPTEVILEHFLERPVSADEIACYFEQLARSGPIDPYPGIRGALEHLHGRVPLGVYSGASSRACEIVLGEAKLAPFFDVVVGGDRVSRPKPDPEGLVLAADGLGVPVQKTAYVGDAERDAAAARACRAVPVLVAWGHEFTTPPSLVTVLRTPADLARLVAV